ncbi:MAG: head GIN domain-containing protein [Ferruginibacter sp.]
MKKILLSFCFILVAGLAFSQKQLVYDANAKPREVNGKFDRIKVSNAIDLYVSQSESQALAVSASEEKYIEGIKTVVEDGLLKIYYDGDKGWGNRNMKLKIYVSVTTLNSLEATGASDVLIAATLKTGDFKLTLSGASDFKGEIKAETLKVQASGASDVSITGKSNTLIIESSGASDFKGYGFETATCKVNCSGASDVQVTVHEEISAQASGASSVLFKGNAILKESEASGASNIRRKS